MSNQVLPIHGKLNYNGLIEVFLQVNWKVRRVFSLKNAVYNAVVEDLDWRVAGLLFVSRIVCRTRPQTST